MAGDFGNPYQSPGNDSQNPYELQQRVKGRVMAPAIALIVVGIVGLLGSFYNVFHAFTAKPVVDPNAPVFVQEMSKSATGPVAAVVQIVFVIVNLVIIAGASMMLRIQSWGMALTSTILAMVTFGTCCCVVGSPVGIWSLVILLQPDVKAAFAASSHR
jgi:hypothetical protein